MQYTAMQKTLSAESAAPSIGLLLDQRCSGERLRPSRSDARMVGSANLAYTTRTSPCPVSREDRNVQTVPKCQAEPVGQRETLTRAPTPGCLLGIVDGHRLDDEAVAEEERTGENPVPTAAAHLLGDLGPVRRTARPTPSRAASTTAEPSSPWRYARSAEASKTCAPSAPSGRVFSSGLGPTLSK